MDASREISVAPGITLTCITAEALDLLDTIIEQCPPAIADANSEREFIFWLIDQSGLVDTVLTAEQVYEHHQVFARRVSVLFGANYQRRDRVYGCAYYLVRYSGLITPRSNPQGQ